MTSDGMEVWYVQARRSLWFQGCDVSGYEMDDSLIPV